MVTVKIKNSGDGVSSEALPYIFERFYKEDTSRSVHVKGAGIGLFIVRTLVTRSGGEIWVESDGKSYTEFIFTLPCAKGKTNNYFATGQKRKQECHREEKRQEKVNIHISHGGSSSVCFLSEC